jgi:hypothetical protein
MLALGDRTGLKANPASFERSFDREPFAYAHDLDGLSLFSERELCELAGKYVDRDYYVASGAPSPSTAFYSVPNSACHPREAMKLLGASSYRILLKRPENYDRRYRDLLDALFAQVLELCGGLGTDRIVRLDSSVLVSSAATVTPFHFDPEVSFFFQIEGAKVYHVYAPAALTEPELERFYVKGVVNIGQVELDRCNPSFEHAFELGPGKGLHQPRNAPHWVETRNERSVSYVFSFETDRTRAVGRTRSFNHYERKIGLAPSPLGTRPSVDAFKAEAMRIAIPIRKNAAATIRKILSR